ncbi:MAG: transglycosylase family protein [Solirubrobacterales bacterium]
MSSPTPSAVAVVLLRAAALALAAILIGLWAPAPWEGVSAEEAVAKPSAGEKELEKAESRVERLSDELTGSRERFDRLDREAESARVAELQIEQQLADGQRRLVEIGDRLRSAREAAALAAQRLESARSQLADRLVAIYESGTSNAVAILLATEDFGDLAASGAYLEAIADSERELAERIADLRRQRLESLGQVRRSRELLVSERGGLRSARESAAATRLEAEQSMTRLTAVQDARERKIDALKDEVTRIESELDSGTGAANFAGGPYAIPTYIVMCESGGNYSALNPSSGAGGAYQIIPSTWEAYGGEGLPHQASKAEQDRIAALIWESAGPGAWVCA